MERRRRFGAAGACAAAALLGLAASAGATSVRSVSVGEMLERAELVFEGRVLTSRTVRSGSASTIRTCVAFEVLEVVKGAPVASPLELCFAGGRDGRAERRVAGMLHPTPGERGIYFVESLAEPRMNPFYGWQQGHFRVQPGPAEVVTTADGKPVLAVDSASGPATGPSHGVARGARVREAAAPSGGPAPMDAAAFKARLRSMMQEGE